MQFFSALGVFAEPKAELPEDTLPASCLTWVPHLRKRFLGTSVPGKTEGRPSSGGEQRCGQGSSHEEPRERRDVASPREVGACRASWPPRGAVRSVERPCAARLAMDHVAWRRTLSEDAVATG